MLPFIFLNEGAANASKRELVVLVYEKVSGYWRYPRDILEPAEIKNDVNSIRSVEYRSGRQRLVRLPLAEGIICLISLSADEASSLRTNEGSGSLSSY